ncbi:FecR family protein [Thermoflexibacter ruber]|uniref:Ferric-dicitrate binding protein FerR, regulates iron transport through sigma-19 n=1 Tax=Thermoflexibacter ruber TaxID=1003 RepID=A0A1I2JJ11_9BACT|nr:FecR family protein [Thermoflexibacter ruber]SFF52816.1 ferric-dicitrate binding protein FerR, regulates iron transport through sigma-19 [Thermoflexibacter ruber]
METNWELIAKYLAGEANAEEESKLWAWRNQNPNNEEFYQEMYRIWHSKKQDESTFDSHLAFKKLTYRIEEESLIMLNHKGKPYTKQIQIFFKKYAIGIAATIAFCLIVIAVWWRNENNQKTVNQSITEIKSKIIEKINPKGQKLQLRLPDGTKVWLNSESRLTYPSQFQGNMREISLNGEAFFEVAHNPNKPFCITTPKTKMQVLGTSFNVRAFDDEQKTETVVVTGKVKISEAENEANFVVLSPNEKGNFSLQNKKISKQKVNPANYIAWKEGILKFENSNMSLIIKELERWYGVTITVSNPNLLRCHLTGDFKNESLENVLIFMQKALDIQFEINQKEVKIKGKACR